MKILAIEIYDSIYWNFMQIITDDVIVDLQDYDKELFDAVWFKNYDRIPLSVLKNYYEDFDKILLIDNSYVEDITDKIGSYIKKKEGGDKNERK